MSANRSRSEGRLPRLRDATLGFPGRPTLGLVDLGPRRLVAREHRIKILNLLQQLGRPARWQELKEAGVEYHALREMVREGTVLYPLVGIFALQADYDTISFALSVMSVHGTEFYACLATAASYHQLTSDVDNFLWMVIPNNRNTVAEVYGQIPVPVRWNPMRMPGKDIEVSDSDREALGWYEGMPEEELTERYFGIFRVEGYGAEFRITSPARTVCDLLYFRNKPTGCAGMEGYTFGIERAYAALQGYAARYDLEDALKMAERLGYGNDVTDFIRIAESAGPLKRKL